MKKIELCMIVFAIIAIFTTIGLAMPTSAQEVYLVPQHSSVAYCNTTNVEIWVNATNFQTGQINLTCDPACANVTSWTMNSATFPMGGWTHSVGSEWITFLALSPLAGKYKVGTLTIHCISKEDCNTTLDFVTTGAEPSKLFDPYGNETPASWTDGTFKPILTPTPSPSPIPPSGDSSSYTYTPTPLLTPSPTPTPTPTPLIISSLTPTPKLVPSPLNETPMPSPAPISSPTPRPPGFEVLFAIAGILVVAYLVGRRKRA